VEGGRERELGKVRAGKNGRKQVAAGGLSSRSINLNSLQQCSITPSSLPRLASGSSVQSGQAAEIIGANTSFLHQPTLRSLCVDVYHAVTRFAILPITALIRPVGNMRLLSKPSDIGLPFRSDHATEGPGWRPRFGHWTTPRGKIPLILQRTPFWVLPPTESCIAALHSTASRPGGREWGVCSQSHAAGASDRPSPCVDTVAATANRSA